jgi:hypothetical protein
VDNTFIVFKEAVQKQMQLMFGYQLFKVDIEKDVIWDIYLNSFPEGMNPIYKERREYDCNCCKQFIRDAGGVIAVKNGVITTVWDGEVGYPYTSVAKALSDYVRTRPIKNAFFHYTEILGTDSNKQLLEGGSVTTWNHFHAKLPRQFVKPKDSLGTLFSNLNSGKDVFKRSLEEISIPTIETVLELIEQNSIYRGEEHKRLVQIFLSLKKEFNEITELPDRDLFCWTCSVKNEAVARIRNSVIGTLMVDIESGMDLDRAVKAFEVKVAPANYKRPTAVITKRMIETAQGEIEKLGLTESLQRRHALVKDISVNDIIFANRTPVSAVAGDIFDEMKGDIKVNPKELKKVEEVSIGKFITDIVPKASSLKVLLENRHVNNLVNLIAPVHAEAAPLFKWGNGFSWSYNGDVADSIKARVKRAGGCVDAVLRCSLSWFNTDDEDIHVREPNGNEISYQDKSNRQTTGKLDIDMNVDNLVRDAVENIVWTNESKMQEGVYEVFVNNYTKREDIDVGFVVEIEYKGVTYTFSYSKPVRHKENVTVAKFNFSRETGITFIQSLPEESLSKTIWGIDTQKYHDIRLMLNSPNHWGGGAIGNKHWLLMLSNCFNPSSSRGFYNEFLREDLTKHRKVFEVLASKTKVPASGEQLCGVGFSSTKKDHFYCQVSGTFSRTVKVNII